MVYNFSPGPAVLPKAVLEKAQSELGNWQGSGMSVMEMSHRGSHFSEISANAEANLRTLLNIPEDYKVLFFQGGASTQFSAIPLNLLRDKSVVNYLETGSWSAKAIKEAKRYADVNVVASSKDSNYQTIPQINEWNMDNSGAYFHYCPNETIQGLEFHWIPDVEQTLVADMSSTILSRPIDVSKFGMIYAGAQKNIGPAGLTLVIVKEELIGHAASNTPAMLDYKVQSDSGSMYNTPPTFAWYMAGLVFEWILEQGGLTAMANHNHSKASKLYKAIDNSNFYSNPVDINCRSWMNVPFILADSELDKVFLEKAAQDAGLLNLKGHRSVGGMRASIYNAMPLSGVDALIDFMQDFEQKHG